MIIAVLVAAIVPTHAFAQTKRPSSTTQTTESASGTGHYTYRKQHDPNGIGKFYMGREIAMVMGHEAADWLERPEREAEESPGKLITALKLHGGEVVADIGAGSGYLTTRLAKAVGPTGRVKAVDIQPEMIELLKKKLAERNITNVDSILSTESDPKLPAKSIDMVLMVDVYHEFAFPYEMMQRIVRSLKPTGRVVFVEYRREDPKVPIKLVHKMTKAQVIKEMNAVGLQHKETIETLPRQHIIIFEQRKPSPAHAEQEKEN